MNRATDMTTTTQQAARTPGRWIADNGDSDVWCIAIEATGQIIAELCKDHGPQDAANAAFIVEACNNYEQARDDFRAEVKAFAEFRERIIPERDALDALCDKRLNELTALRESHARLVEALEFICNGSADFGMMSACNTDKCGKCGRCKGRAALEAAKAVQS